MSLLYGFGWHSLRIWFIQETETPKLPSQHVLQSPLGLAKNQCQPSPLMSLFLAAILCGVAANPRVKLRSHLPICSLTTKIDDTSISAGLREAANSDYSVYFAWAVFVQQTLSALVVTHLGSCRVRAICVPSTSKGCIAGGGGKCILLGRTQTVPAGAVHWGKVNPGLNSSRVLKI